MIRVLIIEDNQDFREVFKEQLIIADPSIRIIGETDNIKEASQLLQTKNFDLAFLDVQLKDGMIFDVLKIIPKIQGDIVFLTSHNDFGVDAFKLHALHYLLKPIDVNDLKEVFERYRNKKENVDFLSDKIQNLLSGISGSNKKINISTMEGYEFIDIIDIIRLEADGAYTKIVLENKRTILSSCILKYFEEILPANEFYRVHRTHLVSKKGIVRYKRVLGGCVVMKDGAEIDVSRRSKQDFMVFMDMKL